ncbi:MAG: FAD-dependent oxidoreductase [Nanoarchaeota archaeon]|nr:FAD-dependent oxidoreductase [Nanoarchaeota archaeon]
MKNSKKDRKNIVIFGAGISGLSTAVFLLKRGHKVIVLEKESHVGGMCSSYKYKGFTIDYGPHKIYSQLPGMMKYFRNLLGDDNLVIRKKNSIALLGKYFTFPPNIMQMIGNITPQLVLAGIGTGMSFMWTTFKGIFVKGKNISYEDYFMNGFGRQGYNLIFRDYAAKVWGDPKNLSEEIARKRTPVPSVPALVKNILFGVKDKPDVSAEFFYYPKQGIQGIADKLVEEIQKQGGKIILGAVPETIELEDNRVSSILFRKNNKKEKLKADYLVSSINIDTMISLIKRDVPDVAKYAAKQLKYRALVLIHFVINKDRVMDDNWIFFPEKKFIFNRVSEQKSFSPYTCPNGKTLITAEVTCNKEGNLYNMSTNEIVEIVKKDLIKAGILKSAWVEEYLVKRFDKVYPVYDLHFKQNLNAVLKYLDTIPNLLTIGRPGLFNYNNMDHCIDMAKVAAEHIDLGKSPVDWINARKYFDSYRIVD